MDLSEMLERFVPADAAEARHRDRIRDFVARHAHPFARDLPEGHLTASAFVVSSEGTKVLLLHHRKLGRWLQPGGHGEPGEQDAEATALREAREETGLQDLTLHATAPRPLDLDVHSIPARGTEKAHDHLDLRFLVTASTATEPKRNVQETNDLRWFSWEQLGPLDLDPGLQRGLAKARRFWP